MKDRCKYYNQHLETIREYIKCLYSLEECRGSGGLLHILLDDDNIEDDHIAFCWKECIQNPEREESKIGQLICEEYMKLSMPQRRLLTMEYIGNWQCDHRWCECETCYIQNGDEFED